jgi:signal transduction histidine kinase
MVRALATPAPPTTPASARRLLRAACGTVVFVLLGLLGRHTVIDRGSLDLIWPAAGVAALWFSSGNRHTWSADAAALAVATLGVNLATGAPVETTLVFVVSNLLQVAVFVAITRRCLPHVWGLGGREPLHRLLDLGRLVGSGVASSFVGAASGAVGVWLLGSPVDPAAVLVWWGRNSVSVVVLVTLGLVVGPPLFAARSPRELGRILYDAVRARTIRRLVEAELLIAVSIGTYGVLFGQRDAQPLSFLVLAVSVWAGLRFSPSAVVLHGATAGAAGLLFTLAGYGPFAGIESPHSRALVAQVFVVTTVLTGLALAFSRTERDQATRRLAQARREADERARLLGAVLESMTEGVVVVEEGGRVVLTNSATPQLLGIEELHGKLRPAAAYGLFHTDGTPLSDQEIPGLRSLGGEEIPPTDFHLRVDSVPQGRVLEIGVRPLPEQRPGDRPLAMINIRDVTLDRQHRDALASFAGVVAHDLFNPLTIVTGWAESLEEEFGDGSVQPSVGLPMLARLREAAQHMRHVIGDLLAYTVARDQSLRPGPVDLTAEVRALAQLRAEGPATPLISVAPDMHAWADSGLVRQLFDNLLGNAVKYVAPGVRPHVDVRARRDGDWLEVRVTDNGIGIPEDQRDLVFETFHRVQRDGYQGTGLGLAICRRIADRHGGSIHAEAAPNGTGTTFVVRLPATAAGYGAPTTELHAAEPPQARSA